MNNSYLKWGVGALAVGAAAYLYLNRQANNELQSIQQQPIKLDDQSVQSYLNRYKPEPGMPLIGRVSRNSSGERKPDNQYFVGITSLKQKHKEQLADFERFAKSNNWASIQSAHYDWWMFPIDRPSQGHGDAYNVTETNVAYLRDDAEFMNDYRRGVHLRLLSWGWDTGG